MSEGFGADFKFGGFMALLTSLTFVVCAAVELTLKGTLTKRKGTSVPPSAASMLLDA